MASFPPAQSGQAPSGQNGVGVSRQHSRGNCLRQQCPQQQRRCTRLQAESDSKTDRRLQAPSSPPAPSRPLPETDGASVPGPKEPFSSPSSMPARQTYKSAYIIFSRAGVFVRLPGVDVARFQESMTTGGPAGICGCPLRRVHLPSWCLLARDCTGYQCSIILQLLSTSFPYLKSSNEMRGLRDDSSLSSTRNGPPGLAFVQAFGQLTYIRAIRGGLQSHLAV
ncbi:hypothetical protein WJX84_008754 [Apatococcus fuscideae]|uniref:Uncharacterized protein n=1 Tax=Apatococcus fuscideae TaxID=2026836 RepID=A0AAW1TGU8_9CHLO